MAKPDFTIGIEEEYQIIEPEGRELTSYVQEFVEQGKLVLKEQIKPEFLQSQIEVGSTICQDIAQARSELRRLRRAVVEVAEANGLRVAAASTHPFSTWFEQEVTRSERYAKHMEEMAFIANRMLIFGMHVHVGIDDPDLRIDLMNQATYFLPHLLALSTSSPFWHGINTGLKSYRSIVFESLPRTGPPPAFRSWSEYERFVDTLTRTGCIEDATRIWWDLRPHPKFPTIEFRVCDICTTIDEAICLAALIQALVAKLYQLRTRNQSWRRYRHHLIQENKWRAVRYGVDGKLLDFGRDEEVSGRQLARELVELVADVAEELGTTDEIAYVETILQRGTSADRQVAVWKQTGDLKKVVDHVIEETKAGC
ncbi:MAG: carboxylate-amine ligase [Thermoanaerobaculia bacterium]|nr:carboxylate-amine ligase [Thermoanaerobaculia bacterium]